MTELYGKSFSAVRAQKISDSKFVAILEFIPPFPAFTSLGVIIGFSDPKAMVCYETDGAIAVLNVSDLKIP